MLSEQVNSEITKDDAIAYICGVAGGVIGDILLLMLNWSEMFTDDAIKLTFAVVFVGIVLVRVGAKLSSASRRRLLILSGVSDFHLAVTTLLIFFRAVIIHDSAFNVALFAVSTVYVMGSLLISVFKNEQRLHID